MRLLNRLRSSIQTIIASHSARIAALVAVAYYIGAQFGFALRFPGSPLSVIWPPNAIVLAALLLTPTRMWWPILVAILPAHILVEYQNGVEPWAILGLYVTNCGQAVLGAVGIRFVFRQPPRLDSLWRAVVFGICAVFGAPFIVSFLDTAIAVLTRWDTSQPFQIHWWGRFVSNALTALVLTPVIFFVAAHWRTWRWPPQVSPQRGLEAIGLAIAIVASGVLVFATNLVATTGQTAFLYLPLPLLLWAALRFGIGGTSIASLGIVLLSTGWSGGVVRVQLAPPTAALVIALQLFLIALSAPMLLLAALIEEHYRTAADLRESEERYRDLVETQTELICRYLPDGTLTFVNEAYCDYYGVTRENLLGTKFFDLLPIAAGRRSQALLDRFARNPSVINDEHTVALP
ncbi:MAG TPA: MASE1 domain-containing protein, partial [Ktedonobacterales bacterium]|nr:MASE1 domain-containing protein [Ktedonobacterales bacterium]